MGSGFHSQGRWYSTDSLIRWVAFAIGLAIVLLSTYRTVDFRLDDALIYARYARNFLAGYGLVYNPYEIHNGVTSPLFIWLLVGAGALGLDIPSAANLIGGICTAITVYLLIFHLFPRFLSPLFAASAGLLFATANFNYITFGMESPLFILLLTSMLVTYQSRRWTLFAVMVGLGGLARFEAVFLAAPLYLGIWIQTRRLPWRLGIISLSVMVPFFLYNLSFYGHILPDTLTAKVGQGRSGLWGAGWVFLHGARDIFQSWYISQPFLFLSIALGSLSFLGGRKAQLAYWIALFIGALLIFYTLLPVPAYHWYLLPIVWALCILVPLGVGTIYRLSLQYMRSVRYVILALGSAGLLILFVVQIQKLEHVPDSPVPSYLRIAQWMKANLPKNSRMGAAEVGHLGWYTNFYIVDMVGLTSPKNADFLAHGDVDSWLVEYKPDYILVHDPPFPVEEGAVRALMRNQYRIQEGFSEPGFILLGVAD